MKRLLLVILAMITIFSGCRKWDEPEYIVNEWDSTGVKDSQFWTIGLGNKPPNDRRHILKMHVNGTPPNFIIDPRETTTMYLRAVVVSSDEGGNYYKSLVIQDSTGGVELQLDMVGLYNVYPVGQKVVIALNGLFIGDYNNLPQVGWVYNETQVGRVSSLYIDKYIIKDGQPSVKNLPEPLTNNKIDFVQHTDINKLVRLEGVTFKQNAIGQPLAYNDFTTDWIVYVPLANGNKQEVTVRTSNFSKFRSMIIEDKEYNLTGILTIYRNSYQLSIRTREDIEATKPDDAVVFDFTKSLLDWKNVALAGTTQWGHRDNSAMHFGNKDIVHQKAMDDWLISPVITYPDYAKGYLHFEHQLPVDNAHYEPYQIYYTTSTSNIFNLVEWKPFVTEFNSYPNTYGWSGNYSLSSINSSTFRIAFRYNAPDTNIETYNWNIRKVEIRK